jgi:Fibrobacter succinogenes major domain (Fib_succ_major).
MWSCTTTVNNITSPKTTIDTTAGTMTDIDGNVYTTVKIGSQTWMAENLKTTKFNDGSTISYITTISNWELLMGVKYNTIPEFCYYNNLYSNRYTYGALYNSSAVMSGKLGPTGWHVPSLDEWQTAYKTDSLALKNVLHKGGMIKYRNNSLNFILIDTTNICWCSDNYTDAYGEVIAYYVTYDCVRSMDIPYYAGCSVRLVKD